MSGIFQWMRKHTYEAYLIAFTLMIVAPALLYNTVRQGWGGWTWVLLFVVVVGNLIALFVR